MQTPDTKAGRITDAIMQRISEKIPNLPTHTHNQIYSAVLTELELRVGDSTAIRFPGGGGMMVRRA